MACQRSIALLLLQLGLSAGWQPAAARTGHGVHRRAAGLRSALAMEIEDDSFLVQSLLGMKERFNELTEQLSDPEVVGDSSRLQQVSKERARLEKRVVVYDAYHSAKTQLVEARSMLQEETDPELKEMAREEMRGLETQQQELYDALQLLLLPSDPNDEKNVMLEIRAGTGGDEAAIWAGDLVKVYQKYAESQSWTISPVTLQSNEAGGYSNAVLELKGDSVYSKMKYEAGVHRVQRVPATETQGRIHTSTATVAIMPEVSDVDVKIDPKEITLCAAPRAPLSAARRQRPPRCAPLAPRATLTPARPGGPRAPRPQHDRPLERRGWAEREQGRDRGRPGPPADGHPHLLPAGALAAQEPRARHVASPLAPLRPRARQAELRAGGEAARAGGLGLALREDPHVQLQGQPVHRPPALAQLCPVAVSGRRH